MRTGTLIIAAMLSVLAVTAAACGGGGDDADSTATPVATVASFDRQLLTGVVLNPSDVPEGFTGTGYFAPEGVSFTSVFSGEGLRYQSTVVHFDSEAEAQVEFQRNRKVFPAFGANEANYEIPGTDLAFIYSIHSPPGLAAWAVRGNQMILLQIAPEDARDPNPAALDQAEFARIARIVGERVDTLQRTPELITPIPTDNEALQTPTVAATGAPEATPEPTP